MKRNILLLFGLAFSVYLRSARPGVWWYDCSQLACSAASLGISHPPGHPLLALTGHLSIFLNLGNQFMRMNLLSGLLGAFSVASIPALMAVFSQRDRSLLGRDVARALRVVGGPLAGVLFVFTETQWMRCTLTEVNALHIFLLYPFALYLWMETSCAPSQRRLSALLLILGLATVDHGLTVVLGLPLAIWMLLRPWLLRRSGQDPTASWSREVGAWLTQGVRAAALVLPIFVYMAIRADCPALFVWGQPDKASGWLQLVLMEEYRGRCFEPTTLFRFFYRMQRFFSYFPDEMGWTSFFAWIAGFFWLVWRIRRTPQDARWSAVLSVLMLSFLLIAALGYAFIMTVERHLDFQADNHTFYYVDCCFVGIAAAALVARLRILWTRRLVVFGWMFLALVPALFNVHAGWGRSDYGARIYTRKVYGELDRNALFVPKGDNQIFLPFTLHQVAGLRADVGIFTPFLMDLDPRWTETLRDASAGNEMDWRKAAALAGAPIQFPAGQSIGQDLPVRLRGYTERLLPKKDLSSDVPAPSSVEKRRKKVVARVWEDWSEGTVWDRWAASTILVDMAGEWSRGGSFSPEALLALERAQRLKPDHPEIHSRLATLYADGGLSQEAERHFEAACGLQRWDPKPYMNYGIWLKKEGRNYEAIPQFVRAAKVSRTMRGTALKELGSTYVLVGNRGKGVELLKRAAALGAERDLFWAVSLLQGGDPQRAAGLLLEIVAEEPGDWEAREWLARALEEQGDFGGAMAQHRWLVTNGPDPAGHWLEMGSFLASAGNMEEAVNAWAKCLDLDPKGDTLAKVLGNLERLAELGAQLPDEQRGPVRQAEALLEETR